MKLELIHLAPYLPYRLNLWVGIDGSEYKTTFTGFQNFMGKLHVETNDNSGYQLHTFNSEIEGEFIKPILRPLSDITDKEIRYLYFIVIGTDNDMYGTIDEFIDYFNETEPYHLPYCVFRQLLEWHIDVFGLIDKELAIDKNTLTLLTDEQ